MSKNRLAELQAKLTEMEAKARDDKAKAFAAEQRQRGRLIPAQNQFVSMYVQAMIDDEHNPLAEGSRAEMVESTVKNAWPHQFLEEKVPAYILTEDEVIEVNDKGKDHEIIEGNLRQRIITLLLMMYGKLEVPNDENHVRNKTRIKDFFVFLTGQSPQNTKTLLVNPTAYSEGVEKSRDALLNDLRKVRSHFALLNETKFINALESEAKTILDLEAEDLEETKKNKKNFL